MDKKRVAEEWGESVLKYDYMEKFSEQRKKEFLDYVVFGIETVPNTPVELENMNNKKVRELKISPEKIKKTFEDEIIMERLEAYEKVNQCETFLELANVIRSLANDLGEIQGKSRKFSAEKMAQKCENFVNYPANTLTREFGIRQQALYILYYTKK